jgi:hypothetical protein
MTPKDSSVTSPAAKATTRLSLIDPLGERDNALTRGHQRFRIEGAQRGVPE